MLKKPDNFLGVEKMVIVNEGKKLVARFLNGETVGIPTHIAIGTVNTIANKEDTILGNEVVRVAVSTKRFLSPNELALTATFDTSTANGQTIKEVGVFTASSGGTMYERTAISDLDKTSSFSIDVTLVLRIL